MDIINELFKEWQSLQPLKEEYKKALHKKFMLEFNYNSNHIEGNTLTYGQTKLLLLFDRIEGIAKMQDLEEMKAHNLALNIIESVANDKEIPLTEVLIRRIHKILIKEDYLKTQNLNSSGDKTTYTVHAGNYKTKPNSVITITGETFEYASPEETPSLMTDLVEWYNKAEKEGKYTPIELASLFHYRFIRIHPFDDGNGRIARLFVNYILKRHGYPMIIVRTDEKEEYLTILNICDVNVGDNPSNGAKAKLEDIKPFVEFLESCLERSLEISIRAARGEDLEEDNDWIKDFKVNYNHKLSKPEKTEEICGKIIELNFKPLISKTKNTISEFRSIFDHFNWKFENESVKQDDKANYSFNIELTEIINDNEEIDLTIKLELIFRQYHYYIRVKTQETFFDSEYPLNPFIEEDVILKKEFNYNIITLEKDVQNCFINTIGRCLRDFKQKADQERENNN